MDSDISGEVGFERGLFLLDLVVGPALWGGGGFCRVDLELGVALGSGQPAIGRLSRRLTLYSQSSSASTLAKNSCLSLLAMSGTDGETTDLLSQLIMVEERRTRGIKR